MRITTWARACFPGCIIGAEAEHVNAVLLRPSGVLLSGEDTGINSLHRRFPSRVKLPMEITAHAMVWLVLNEGMLIEG